MMRNGWALHSHAYGASKMSGYTDPVATKTANGDLEFQYDAQVERYGMFGRFTGGTVIGEQRLTNFIARASLHPATNLVQLGFAVSKPIGPVASQKLTDTTSDVLPLLKVQVDYRDLTATLPSKECVFWSDGQWVWYVPPRHDGDFPTAAFISSDITRTPGYIYPARLVLFPVALAGDIIFWPTFYIASGGHPYF
jgi:hypothetical protein